jgi:C2 domain
LKLEDEEERPKATTLANISSLIEISISCRELRRMDTLSLSDPQCRVFELNSKTQKWRKIGETEVIMDTCDPDFKTTLRLPYCFERTQKLKFEIWDYDSPTKYKFIGESCSSIGIIMGSKGQTINSKLLDSKNVPAGLLIVRADSIELTNDILAL